LKRKQRHEEVKRETTFSVCFFDNVDNGVRLKRNTRSHSDRAADGDASAYAYSSADTFATFLGDHKINAERRFAWRPHPKHRFRRRTTGHHELGIRVSFTDHLRS